VGCKLLLQINLTVVNMQAHLKENKMDINKSINHFMAQQGYIQMDLSRHSKLHPSTISLIRNSHRTPSLDTVQALSEMFNVKVSEFIAAGE